MSLMISLAAKTVVNPDNVNSNVPLPTNVPAISDAHLTPQASLLPSVNPDLALNVVNVPVLPSTNTTEHMVNPVINVPAVNSLLSEVAVPREATLSVPSPVFPCNSFAEHNIELMPVTNVAIGGDREAVRDGSDPDIIPDPSVARPDGRDSVAVESDDIIIENNSCPAFVGNWVASSLPEPSFSLLNQAEHFTDPGGGDNEMLLTPVVGGKTPQDSVVNTSVNSDDNVMSGNDVASDLGPNDEDNFDVDFDNIAHRIEKDWNLKISRKKTRIKGIRELRHLNPNAPILQKHNHADDFDLRKGSSSKSHRGV